MAKLPSPQEIRKEEIADKTFCMVSQCKDLLDTMLSSIVELLEEKGIITQEEYEKRIKEKVKVK